MQLVLSMFSRLKVVFNAYLNRVVVDFLSCEVDQAWAVCSSSRWDTRTDARWVLLTLKGRVQVSITGGEGKNEVSLTGPDWCNYDWKAPGFHPTCSSVWVPDMAILSIFKLADDFLILLTYGPVRSILLPKCALFPPRASMNRAMHSKNYVVCVFTHRNITFIYICSGKTFHLHFKRLYI